MPEKNSNNTNSELEEARKKENRKKAVKAGAKLAAEYLAPGVGAKAVDLASKTKAGQNALNKGAKAIEKIRPVDKSVQKAGNSGALNVLDKASSLVGGSASSIEDPSNLANSEKDIIPGGDKSSLPSLVDKKPGNGLVDDFKEDNLSNEEQQETAFNGNVFFKGYVKTIIISVVPFLFGLIVMMIPIILISNIFGENEDSFGVSYIVGEEDGDMDFEGATPEQKSFYERINNVKLEYQAQGKTVDAVTIVKIYTTLKENGAKLTYNDMTESTIKEFADAMFENNVYNEEVFKNNLINNIIPKYISLNKQTKADSIALDIIENVENYNSLVGKNIKSVCSSGDSCQYNIKGFYIKSKGNIVKNYQISNLYVRLMQCGRGNGHDYGGTFGKALEGEELVPFEKYILGVAYQEIGPSAPKEAIKAQMVAARSYILARHVDMGGWRTLKQEGDKWVLQAASCTQDQVYCDPDQGCSSNNGQWSQVYSGIGHGRTLKQALPITSPLREYAKEVSGEVLVNGQGNVVYSGYVQTEQNKFISLAKSGLDYKQILLQVYNQGKRNYGATGIEKASCGGSGGNCKSTSTLEYASWKQYEGSWTEVKVGMSGRTIKAIGCLATSVAIQIAKSGVPTNITDFNPGTFVEYLNKNGGFSGGNFIWGSTTKVAPSFKYQNHVVLKGYSKEQKLQTIKNIVNQPGVYAVAEVKGNTGQHWVAIDFILGNKIMMMDPGSKATDMWAQYNWANTSRISYYKVG